MIIIGIDGSSSKYGYCIYDTIKKEILELSYKIFDPKNNLLQKADEFKDHLSNLISQYKITDFVIEESFSKFTGKTTPHTIAILNQINILYQYTSYLQGLNINTISVHNSRKYAFVDKKPSRKIKIKEKEQMFAFVLDELGPSYFPTHIISKGKRKGVIEYEEVAGDISDSYVVLFGYLRMNKII